MKTVKVKIAPLIVCAVIFALSLITCVVFAVLPEDVYYSWNIHDWETTRNVILLISGLFALVFLLVVIAGYFKQKKDCARLNEMLRMTGEGSLLIKGVYVDPEKTRENAKKTAVSVLGGFLSALFLGVGVYRIYGQNNSLVFILYKEGLYVHNFADNSELLLHRGNVKNIRLTEKRKSILIEFVGSNVAYKMFVNNLDISKEDLCARLKELFSHPESSSSEQVAALNV